MPVVVGEVLNSGAESQSSSPLFLSPHVCAEVQAFLEDQKLIFDLVNGFGSPLNIIFPDLLKKNIEHFEEVFSQFCLSGKIYFAHKTNRSDTIIKKLSTENVCIDVASASELKHALGSGFSAYRIEATGPKNVEFLTLALAHNVVINIDSISELEQLIRLKKEFFEQNKTCVLLRLSDFGANSTKVRNKSSRFGICRSEIKSVFYLLSQSKDIQLKGFAFHLDTVNMAEKVAAIEYCIELFEQAFGLGFHPNILNIGGGFKLNYLAQQAQWHDYTTALREAVIGARPAITWQGNSFGLIVDKQGLRGSFNSYSYYDALTGPKFLKELLQQSLTGHNDILIAHFLRMNDIELWIEPGRSILDQVGLTVGSVVSNRKSSQNENLVCLEMKRQDLCFLDQEFFVDPIILYQQQLSSNDREYCPVYFAGNLCLESDLVYRHQTFIKQMPMAGDLIIFPNTAGYFMDFSACEAIMQPIAAKVAVYKEGDSFAWACDHKYQPRLSHFYGDYNDR